MTRILLVIGALLGVIAIAFAIGAVRQAEDEATLWDEAFGEDAA